VSDGGILRRVDAVSVPVPDLDTGNTLVLVDLSQGTYTTDPDG